jgi:hypothetical protein
MASQFDPRLLGNLAIIITFYIIKPALQSTGIYLTTKLLRCFLIITSLQRITLVVFGRKSVTHHADLSLQNTSYLKDGERIRLFGRYLKGYCRG